MSAARAEILARVRAATAHAAPVAPAAYEPPAQREDDLAALFAERVAEYDVGVRRGGPVAETVAAICAEHGARRLGVAGGLPSEWRPRTVELVHDDALGAYELDLLDGALTGCALAIAETGTIVLDHGPAQGRRALTLVPDLHICVVETSAIVEGVADAFARLRAEGPVTFVSGPSATSDIELSRVRGVHGPRRLEVVLIP
ncbi:MAG TPA: LUD domain-containing protein [Gaiellaceae bacterium]|nr:LUD domain-containing protein [Gaiellaceae bacterium]